MNTRITWAVLLITLTVINACKKNSNDDNNSNNNNNNGNAGGQLTITSTSPEFPFWGDDLTITGTGFSSNKSENFVWMAGTRGCSSSSSNDSTGWRKAEIISATATQLKIRVPYDILKQAQGDRPCGDDYGNIHITVKGKTVVSKTIKMISLPALYEFRNTSSPNAVRPGFEAMLDAMVSPHLQAAGYGDKIRISAEGKIIPIQSYSGTGFGYRFTLSPADFVRMQCTPDAYYGEPGRKVSFKIYIEGTDKLSTRDYFVFNLHNNYTADFMGNFTYSKIAGGNPQINFTGKHMFFLKARFLSQTPGVPHVTIDIPSCSGCSEQFVSIPLSVLVENTSYAVWVMDECGRSKLIGNAMIKP